uniref:Uncharacterized protein n=1 Tax=Anguilla anguilla TaxID=7936 RepID=A0A0E9XWJ3_ANGAN
MSVTAVLFVEADNRTVLKRTSFFFFSTPYSVSFELDLKLFFFIFLFLCIR